MKLKFYREGRDRQEKKKRENNGKKMEIFNFVFLI